MELEVEMHLPVVPSILYVRKACLFVRARVLKFMDELIIQRALCISRMDDISFGFCVCATAIWSLCFVLTKGGLRLNRVIYTEYYMVLALAVWHSILRECMVMSTAVVACIHAEQISETIDHRSASGSGLYVGLSLRYRLLIIDKTCLSGCTNQIFNKVVLHSCLRSL